MTSLVLSEVLTFSAVDRPNGAAEGHSPNCILNKVVYSVFRFMASCSCFFRGMCSPYFIHLSVPLCEHQALGCYPLSSMFFFSLLTVSHILFSSFLLSLHCLNDINDLKLCVISAQVYC